MSAPKDGGPAFPISMNMLKTTENEAVFGSHPGLSLRDWFAGQALTAIGTWSPPGTFSTADVFTSKAKWAYAQADAMLRAREVQS
jgi:hypothetical protein